MCPYFSPEDIYNKDPYSGMLDKVDIFKSGYPEVRGMYFDYLDMTWSLEQHSTPVWEMVYITRGQVRLQIKRKMFRGKPGDILFIPPNIVHRDHFSLPNSYCAYIIFFSWKGAEKFFRKITNRRLCRLSPTTKAKICDLVEQTWAEFKEQKSGFKQIIDMYLAQAFFLLAREFTFPRRVKSHSRLANITVQIKDYIKKNYAKPLSLESIAAHVGISPFYLTHIFSRESGFSPHKYLTLTRINQAKKLLGEKKLIVKEISCQVGFDDPNYFGKVFKKIVGVAPGQFRRSA